MAHDDTPPRRRFRDTLATHPGYLGLTSKGVILIHADWPAYPAEHGWDVALVSLGQFPQRTTFQAIDDIDRCFLFYVGDRAQVSDPFDAKHFHVAAWHEDIQDLYGRGYIWGSKETTLAEWKVRRAKELESLFCLGPDGERSPVPVPTAADFNDDEETLVLSAADSGITISPDGWAFLEKALGDCREHLHPKLAARIAALVDAGPYDAAIREGCVLLETRIREASGSTCYGASLLRDFLAKLRATERFRSTYLKVLGTELRAAFKFVRNDVMHNIRELTKPQCVACLVRLSSLLVRVDELEVAIAGCAR